MKNVQIIDGAENCTYDIFAFTDEEFDFIFDGREVYFIKDIIGSDFYQKHQQKISEIFTRVWKRRVDKKSVVGIHATIFYEQHEKKCYFPDGYWDGLTGPRP